MRSGLTASMTSSALCTRVAPSRISKLQPCARGSSGEPGTAITSRPYSVAWRAVISEPERGAASITTVPWASPAMIRLRQGKWRARGLGTRRLLGDQEPAFGDRRLPLLILGRIDDVDPARDHCDRAARQRAVMRGAVDAAGEARDDDIARRAEIVGELPGEAARGSRGVARADQGDGGPVEQIEVALDDQRRRRGLELRQQGRIEALAEEQVARAQSRHPFDLALDLGPGGEPGRAPATACGEVRDGVDRRLRRAEAGRAAGSK